MKTPLSLKLTSALAAMTTRDSAGRHFTARFSAATIQSLEDGGFIVVHRPMHTPTGIQYGQDHWTVEVTQAGREVFDTHPDCIPDYSDCD